MQFDVVAGIASSPRKFPVHHLPDGTACVAGTAPNQQAPDGSKLVVYSPKGGHTTAHPGAQPYEVYYEIHLGDFVGIIEYSADKEYLMVYSYYIQFIHGNLAHGVPAEL